MSRSDEFHFGDSLALTQDEIEPRWSEIEPTPDQIELNIENLWRFEKLKILVFVEWTFGGHFWSVIMLSEILDVSHYQKW